MPVYRKEVKALGEDWVEVSVFRDDARILWEWFFGLFPIGLEAKLKKAGRWGDKQIDVLQKYEVL